MKVRGYFAAVSPLPPVVLGFELWSSGLASSTSISCPVFHWLSRFLLVDYSLPELQECFGKLKGLALSMLAPKLLMLGYRESAYHRQMEDCRIRPGIVLISHSWKDRSAMEICSWVWGREPGHSLSSLYLSSLGGSIINPSK